jgi:polysaccharide biosynthesis transport protein
MDKDERFVDHMDKLALIDSDSLARLGLFAGLQSNAVNTADFQAAQPARVAEAQTQYQLVLELLSEKKRLMTRFGTGHPQVKDIEDQIEVVTNFLAEKDAATKTGLDGLGALSPEALLRAYIGFLHHDLAALKQRRRELEGLAEYAEAQAKTLIEFELNDAVLSTKVKRQEALFDAVVLQLKQMDTATGLSGYIYELLVTPRPGVKSWPRRSVCAGGGLMLGLFAGLFLAAAADIRDVRFRSASELESFIQIPIIGRIGRINSLRKGARGLIAAGATPDAEAMRLIRTLLLPEVRAGKLRVLGMTSAMQGDGKSTVLSNLAASFSQLGLSVLVIDADLRRPSLHRYFSSIHRCGLSDLLTGDMDPVDAIRETQLENVWIMLAGSSTAAPAELLQSKRFDYLLEVAQEQYDLVLLDLPPVLAVSDPLIVAPKLGGVIMVVRASTARRSEVSSSIRRLKSADADIVGCVLNTHGAGKKFSADGEYIGYYTSGYTPTRRTMWRRLKKRNGKVGRIITARAAPITDMAPITHVAPVTRSASVKKYDCPLTLGESNHPCEDEMRTNDLPDWLKSKQPREDEMRTNQLPDWLRSKPIKR